MRLAYADPPYPGKAHLYPENEEVDHVELIERLREYDGWALSTMTTSLAHCLAIAPEARIAAWVRTNAPPFNPSRYELGPVRSWEPVLYVPCRPAPAVRDTLLAEAPTGFRAQAGLTGTKPRPFCEWLFRILGAEPDDTLADFFPGSGAVGAAWAQFAAQLSLGLDFTNGRNRLRPVHKDNLIAAMHEPLTGTTLT